MINYDIYVILLKSNIQLLKLNYEIQYLNLLCVFVLISFILYI